MTPKLAFSNEIRAKRYDLINLKKNCSNIFSIYKVWYLLLRICGSRSISKPILADIFCKCRRHRCRWERWIEFWLFDYVQELSSIAAWELRDSCEPSSIEFCWITGDALPSLNASSIRIKPYSLGKKYEPNSILFK